MSADQNESGQRHIDRRPEKDGGFRQPGGPAAGGQDAGRRFRAPEADYPGCCPEEEQCRYCERHRKRHPGADPVFCAGRHSGERFLERCEGPIGEGFPACRVTVDTILHDSDRGCAQRRPPAQTPDRIRAAGFDLEEIDAASIDPDLRHFYALDDRLFRARKPR